MTQTLFLWGLVGCLIPLNLWGLEKLGVETGQGVDIAAKLEHFLNAKTKTQQGSLSCEKSELKFEQIYRLSKRFLSSTSYPQLLGQTPHLACDLDNWLREGKRQLFWLKPAKGRSDEVMVPTFSAIYEFKRRKYFFNPFSGEASVGPTQSSSLAYFILQLAKDILIKRSPASKANQEMDQVNYYSVLEIVCGLLDNCERLQNDKSRLSDVEKYMASIATKHASQEYVLKTSVQTRLEQYHFGHVLYRFFNKRGKAFSEDFSFIQLFAVTEQVQRKYCLQLNGAHRALPGLLALELRNFEKDLEGLEQLEHIANCPGQLELFKAVSRWQYFASDGLDHTELTRIQKELMQLKQRYSYIDIPRSPTSKHLRRTFRP